MCKGHLPGIGMMLLADRVHRSVETSAANAC
jgi:hypothetical protein